MVDLCLSSNRTIADILKDGLVEENGLLRQISNRSTVRKEVESGKLMAIDGDLSSRGPSKAVEETQYGALTGATGPYQDVHLTWIYPKRDRVSERE